MRLAEVRAHDANEPSIEIGAHVAVTSDGNTRWPRRPPGRNGLRGVEWIGDELWVTANSD